MSHSHVFTQAKNGKYEFCSCGDRFPCADKACSHPDCVSARGATPKCFFCGDKLKGENNTETSNWGNMLVRGQTRQSHYCCRDANGSTSRREIGCRAKRGYSPEKCDHTFEGKEELSKEEVKTLADNYLAG